MANRPKVQVVETGPRDGFQNIPEFIPSETKLAIIGRIYDAGLRDIQVTSFVSPKAIPQMRDAAEVTEKAMLRCPGAKLFALVPNLHGAAAAQSVGLGEVAMVMSLSESHNMANLRCSKTQSLSEFERVRQSMPNLSLCADIATAFACPYEGKMELEPLLGLLRKLHSLGVRKFTLCDTIGAAYPTQVAQVMKAAIAAFPDANFGIHIHDTRNMGILNTYEALRCGAASLQTTLGGLGGCPFAPGASGNTATEDLVYLLEKEGYDTGVDFGKLLAAAKYQMSRIDGNYSGHHIHISEGECK